MTHVATSSQSSDALPGMTSDKQVLVAQEHVLESDQNEQSSPNVPHSTDGGDFQVQHENDAAADDQSDNNEVRFSFPSHSFNDAHLLERGDSVDSQVQHENVASPVEEVHACAASYFSAS
ncbi:hypothetical protein V6N13_043386 [Hibiscus sabdariffa]